MDRFDDAGISHFIPSTQLTGSREEKLRKLDTLIRHLERLRNSLSNSASAEVSVIESYCAILQPWRTFTAGLIAGAAFAMLTSAAIHWLL